MTTTTDIRPSPRTQLCTGCRLRSPDGSRQAVAAVIPAVDSITDAIFFDRAS